MSTHSIFFHEERKYLDIPLIWSYNVCRRHYVQADLRKLTVLIYSQHMTPFNYSWYELTKV